MTILSSVRSLSPLCREEPAGGDCQVIVWGGGYNVFSEGRGGSR